ncbi:MAG: DNA-binding response regulator [Candidatus Nitrospira kreftii]|uniref:DNA-binding response regulator n=1 Tax=Candidatus Nitrospira kreftii TaxID=2652173 RepID=A0A7S8FA02_9BACT|nr:MAG: DNA-binding response regulator [Candidatus Nitrospira kreftii]
MMEKPRVLMADDHSILLAGVHKLLEDRYNVVGTVEDGRALLEAAERLKPDLILLDISMPLLNGFEAARQLKRSLPEIKLLFLTMHASSQYATEAFKAGGNGYLLKQSAVSELPQAIEAVLQGKYYLTPSIAKPVIEQALKADEKPAVKGSFAELTSRQREVLQLIGEGKGTKEIAELLGLSVKTIEFHKNCLMKELDIHTTAELVRHAIVQGLATEQP